MKDYELWVNLRRKSEAFLSVWEPERDRSFYALSSFKNRVKWAKQKFSQKEVIHAFIFRQEDHVLLGAITLSHMRRGVNQSGSIGYWLGEPYTKKVICLKLLRQ